MAKIVIVKIDDKVYEELDKKARKKGYLLVTDYVKNLILRDLGREEEVRTSQQIQLDLDEIVSKILEKLSASEDISFRESAEKQLARIERKLQDMLNPWTEKIDRLYSKLADTIEKIEAVENELRALKSRVLKLEEAVQSQPPEKKEKPRRKSAIERLREQGVVFEHEVRWLRDRNAFFEKLRREGAMIIDTGEERIAVDPMFWRGFIDKLSEIKTPNEDEIKDLLSDLEYDVFKKLRSNALIYYDARTRSWMLVDILKTTQE